MKHILKIASGTVTRSLCSKSEFLFESFSVSLKLSKVTHSELSLNKKVSKVGYNSYLSSVFILSYLEPAKKVTVEKGITEIA